MCPRAVSFFNMSTLDINTPKKFTFQPTVTTVSWYSNPSRGIQIRLVVFNPSRGIEISFVVFKSVSWYLNPSRGI